MSPRQWAGCFSARTHIQAPLVHRIGAVLRTVLAAFCLLFAMQAMAEVRYYYDELDRLIEVVAPDGASVQYSYDLAGNITAIRKSSASALSLTEFTPNVGPVGTTVTLYGSGFSTTPANNTVKFNATVATVSAASATSLTVTVPTGATTGKITVSNSAGSVQSATNFVVGAAAPAPTIASFTPQIGTAGTVVTVNGTNFQTVVEDNKAAFGGIFATVVKDASSPTPTQLKMAVPNALPSGKVTVTTPYGKAISGADFYAVPASVNLADVQFKGRMVVDGGALAVNITTAGKKAVILFDGLVDQSLHWVTDSGTFALSMSVQIYRPEGVLLNTMTLSNSGVTDFTTRLPSAGTYTAILSPAVTDKGSVNLRLMSDVTGILAVNSTKAVSLSTRRNARYSFTAEAGKGYGLALANLAFTPAGGSMTATLRKADGTYLTACSFSTSTSSSCDFAPSYFAVAGSYLIDFDPSDTYAASFNALLSKDAGGTLTVDAATPTTVTVAREGQNARLSFSGTAGQLVSMVASGSTLDDGNVATSGYTYVYLYKPSDLASQIATIYLYTGTSGGTSDVTLPETGTYTIFVNPTALDQGTLGLQVKSYLTGTLAVDGTTAVSLSTGRNARYSFTAEAGKGYGLELTGLAFMPAGSSMMATLRKDDGTYLNQCNFGVANSCDFAPSNFAATGTYLIDFDPIGSSAASFNALLSKDVSGTLTVDAAAPTTVAIAREGQNAWLNFSGTAGQQVSVVISGNVLDDGNADTNHYTLVDLYKPNNLSYIAYTNVDPGAIGSTIDVTLPETGTYSVLVNPIGLDKGTIGLQVKSYLTGNLMVDSTKAVSLSSGRNARFSFTAEAGKGYGVGITGLTFTPPGVGSISVMLKRADGATLASCLFYDNGTCDFGPSSFATSGTYLIDINPSGTYAASFNLLLSKDAGGALTMDAAAPTTVTIAREGQNARATFSGTAGQLVSVVISGNTLDDGNAATNNLTYVYLYRPDGLSYITSTSLLTDTAGNTLDVTLPQTGTYTVFVNPAALDKGTIGLQVKSDLTGTLPVDSAKVVNLSSGRNAHYSFIAEAGKGYGLAVSGLAFTPVDGFMSVTLSKADGTFLASCNFYYSGSCDFEPSSFASSGIYLISLDPSELFAANFNVLLSKDAGGTLTMNAAAPTTVTIAREGQNARLSFSGTAGQLVRVLISGNTLDDGDSAPRNTYVYLYGPSSGASSIGSTYLQTGTTNGAIDITLPETGTYAVFVNPAGLDKGTIGVQVKTR